VDSSVGQRLAELNRLLAAWIDTEYHATVHSETGAAPLARWQAGLPSPLPLPAPAQLHEAFLWSERRKVTKTATVSLHATPTRSTRPWPAATSSWPSTRYAELRIAGPMKSAGLCAPGRDASA
jgi:hypothetical protein